MVSPTRVNDGNGNTGYDIKSAKRWAVIVGTTIATLAGSGGVLGNYLYSQKDIDNAARDAKADQQITEMHQKIDMVIHQQRELTKTVSVMAVMVGRIDERTKE